MGKKNYKVQISSQTDIILYTSLENYMYVLIVYRNYSLSHIVQITDFSDFLHEYSEKKS